MYRQIEESYWAKNYAIASNALISIIDNHLAFYIEYKGQMARIGIYRPIQDYLLNIPIIKVDLFLCPRVAMLNQAINTLFEERRFNEPIEIKTNKTFRRHTSNHGFQFSNKRIDTLLLLNTLYEVLLLEKELKYFKNSLERKKNGFVIKENKIRKLDKLYNYFENRVED